MGEGVEKLKGGIALVYRYRSTMPPFKVISD
jgi:hypothetical protein